MSKVRVEDSVEIDRPVEEVFTYVTNPENFPQWASPVVEVREWSPGPVAVGDRFTLLLKFLGRRFESPCEVVSVEPGRRYAFRSTGGPIPFTFSYTLLDASTAGTEFTHTGEGEPGAFFGLVGPLLDRALKRQFRHDLETLKDLLEAKA